MKKIIICLFCILQLFIFVNVKADMGAPSEVPVDVYVINKKGAYIYDEDGKNTKEVLEYGEKLKVSYSVVIGKKTYYKIYHEIDYDDEDDDSVYYILKSDFQVINDTMAKSYGITIDSKETFKVINKEGVQLYKGPNINIYGKVDGGIIPYGTIISSNVMFSDSWMYFEYNGKFGWLTVNIDGVDGEFGVYGYQSGNELAVTTSATLIVANNNVKISICEDDFETCKTVDTKIYDEIKSSYVLYPNYGYSGYEYYATYDGVTGWITYDETRSDNALAKYDIDNSGNRTLKNDVILYESYDKKKKIAEIKSGTVINYLGNYFFEDLYCDGVDEEGEGICNSISMDFISYDGKKGFIDDPSYVEDDYKDNDEGEKSNDTDVSTTDSTNNNFNDNEIITSEKSNDAIDDNISSPKKEINKVLYGSIGGAIVLAITAIVTIILVNKKKKNKNIVKDDDSSVIACQEKQVQFTTNQVQNSIVSNENTHNGSQLN